MTGVAILTYNRPDYFKQCLKSILENASRVVNNLYVYNDGSTVPYPEIIPALNLKLFHMKENLGVAKAKNFLLKRMLEDGMTDMFIIEDDILVKDSKAFTEYIRIAKDYGWGHLLFAHHGPANKAGAGFSDDSISYYTACVGAFCYYSKEAIEGLKAIEEKEGKEPYPGFMDENFHNAWEHVEHTKRLGDNNFTGWWGAFADVKNSKEYLEEIPGSIDNSSIRPHTKEWRERMNAGYTYWEKKLGEKPPVKMIEMEEVIK